jgi:hypothetical protein
MAGEDVNRSKEKGTSFESQVVDYLRRRLGDGRIERRTLSGQNDRGDVAGVYLNGKPVVIECKNHRQMRLSEWLDEAEAERGNADAEFAFVVHKRRGCGEKRMGETYVTCDLETLCAVIAKTRWHLNYTREERASGRFMAMEAGIGCDEE